ncbi:MAG: helix-turn-helix domain-containing protein [Clostridiales bacterium]|nr:helix-turn-helix domain-containing protein [Clostridiales bacterium]
MSSILSERIAALRKERGLTQEQLGKLVGVSSQAVGKWEKGGAPDIDLLPILSKQLGVSIDALFGMEAGEQEKERVDAVVGRWLRGFPDEERMNQFCHMVWAAVKYFLPAGYDLPDLGYLESCQPEVSKDSLMYSKLRHGGGILLDVHAEDMNFVTLWPEPKTGYAAWLASKEEYRQLFSLLAKPGCLELLEDLYSRKIRYYVPEMVSKQSGLPIGQVRELLDELTECNILQVLELELTEGEVRAYQLTEPLAFVPFLYMARALIQGKMNYLLLYDDDVPIFKKKAWKEKKQNEKEC